MSHTLVPLAPMAFRKWPYHLSLSLTLVHSDLNTRYRQSHAVGIGLKVKLLSGPGYLSYYDGGIISWTCDKAKMHPKNLR